MGDVNLLGRWRESSLVLSAHPGPSDRPGSRERYESRLRAWSRHAHEFATMHYELAILSAESLNDQLAKHPPVGLVLLSDPAFALAASWPTLIDYGARRAYRDATLILHCGEVTQVFYADREPLNEVVNILEFLRRVADE